MLVHFRNEWHSGLARLPKVTRLPPQLLIKLHDTQLSALHANGTNLEVTISPKDSEAAQLPGRKWGQWSVSHFYRQRNPRESLSLSEEPTQKRLQLCKLSKTLKEKSALGLLALQTNTDSPKGLLQQCPKYRERQEKAVVSLAPSEKLSGATKVFTFLADVCLLESMFSLPVFLTDALACKCSLKGSVSVRQQWIAQCWM